MERARLIFSNMERHLDCAPKISHLVNTDVARMITDAIAHRHKSGQWEMIAYSIMPNRLHIFYKSPLRMKPLLTKFKHWTASRANKSLGLTGRFWQEEWFDHWSRSAEQNDGIVRYIRNNPAKAGLVESPDEWP